MGLSQGEPRLSVLPDQGPADAAPKAPRRASVEARRGQDAQARTASASPARDDKGKLTTVSPVCTHMGCLVHWNAAEKTWDCPCHGSRFQADGRSAGRPGRIAAGTSRAGRRPRRQRQGLPLEAEHLRVGVRPPQEKVGDQPRRDHAERDPVAAVAQGEVVRRLLRGLADVRQPVLGFAERPGPGVSGPESQSRETVFQIASSAARPCARPAGRARDRRRRLCPRRQSSRGHPRSVAHLKVRARCLPDQAAVGPSLNDFDRLACHSVGAVQPAYLLSQVLLRVVSGGKHNALRGDVAPFGPTGTRSESCSIVATFVLALAQTGQPRSLD